MSPRKTAAAATAEPEVPGETSAPVADAPEPAAPTKPSKTEIVVKYRDHAGETVERTFSKEVHGADFAKLADEFKTTNASKIIE